MSRRIYELGVGVALVALSLAFTDWALSWQPGVTETNVKRLRHGMTAQETNALLGEPTRVWQHGQSWHIPGMEDGRVCVWFDGAGRVDQLGIFARGIDSVDVPLARYRFPNRTPDPLSRLRAWRGW